MSDISFALLRRVQELSRSVALAASMIREYEAHVVRKRRMVGIVVVVTGICSLYVMLQHGFSEAAVWDLLSVFGIGYGLSAIAMLPSSSQPMPEDIEQRLQIAWRSAKIIEHDIEQLLPRSNP